jgi:DNA (cytosine-5)-methyltransferase 1
MIEIKSTISRKDIATDCDGHTDDWQESPEDQLSAVEYFAGIGLVRMGLEEAGWRVAFANDFAPKKYEMYRGFFPEHNLHYVVDDIFNLDTSSIPLTTLATCSFPCVDLSLAGNMNGINGRHSSAFWGFINILKRQGQCAPPLILVENVPGWLHSNKGLDFRLTVEALNKLGYACDVFTMDARRFTPQSRLRIFLVGIRHSSSYWDHELLLRRPSSLMSKSLRERVVANSDLNWFHFPLPDPPALKREGLSLIVEAMAEDDARWWPEEQVKRHLDMMFPSHRSHVEYWKDSAFITYRTFFRRIRQGQQRAEVRPDDIAGCLRTASGGSAKQFLIAAGAGQIRMRAMTPREYARLQGVPDSYPINVDTVQALTGFGDAVCVPVITWIANNVLTPLANIYLS